LKIYKLQDCREFTAGDHTRLRELFNPLKDSLDLRYSLAHATLAPGKQSTPHRLRTSEVYYILQGEGEMTINDERSLVAHGQAVYIPPGAVQSIRNNGSVNLIFLCVVDPAWRKDDEEVL
jgi:mannose-6-phosphate isomerase-like protein (cupin superfamily)